MRKRVVFYLAVFIVLVVLWVLKNGLVVKQNKPEKIIRKEYDNVVIIHGEGNNISALVNGERMEFQTYNLPEKYEGIMADIVVENDVVSEISLKRDSITGKILAISEEEIEIEGYGKVAVIPDYKVYAVYEEYALLDRSSINIGDEGVKFIVADKTICGIYVENKRVSGNIRVLLKTTGFAGLFHENVSVTCGKDFILTHYEKNEQGDLVEVNEEYKAGEQVDINRDCSKLAEGRITIKAKDDKEKIMVKTILRNGENPDYRGKIEVSKYDEGLVLINELSIEEYLYAVVPSEMPSSYGVEALKVQAVCARSYAVSHQSNPRLRAYGAHVDDSTDYQVYRNTPETENSINAVDATFGQILKYGDAIANTYFFATSCGVTTDSTIWGGECLPYIRGKMICKDGECVDLSDEKTFDEFIKSKPDSYDSYSGWYRWNISFTTEQITNIINDNLAKIEASSPSNVLVLKDGEFVKSGAGSIGNLTGIEVAKRGDGGIIEELLIKGDKNTVKILKQSAIRNLFNVKGININRNDGSSIDTMTALPSAFFMIEKDGDTITFFGGGYGHGAGMSQTAVKTMIESEMKYEEILKFFYTDVEVENAY